MDVGSAIYDMIAIQWPEYESVVAGNDKGAVPSMMQRDVLAQVQAAAAAKLQQKLIYLDRERSAKEAAEPESHAAMTAGS